MNRFRLYAILGLVNIILFLLSVFFGFQDVAGIIGFVLFLVAIIYLLFTMEEPPSADSLKIVEVHKVYSAKQNNLNTALASEFAFISMFFGILVIYFNLNVAVVVALLWSISIPVLFYTIKHYSRDLLLNNIVAYASLLYPDADAQQFRSIISKFIKAETLNKKELVAIDDNKELVTNLADVYIKYINALPLDSTEIEAINDL